MKNGMLHLVFEARLRANHGWKREIERLWGMFYCDPMVGTKCTYQNLKRVHVRANMAMVGCWTSHVGLRVTFVRRKKGGTYKTKDFDTQVSMWISRVWILMSMYMYVYVSRCVFMEKVRRQLILIVWRGSCKSLLIGAITVM